MSPAPTSWAIIFVCLSWSENMYLLSPLLGDTLWYLLHSVFLQTWKPKRSRTWKAKDVCGICFPLNSALIHTALISWLRLSVKTSHKTENKITQICCVDLISWLKCLFGHSVSHTECRLMDNVEGEETFKTCPCLTCSFVCVNDGRFAHRKWKSVWGCASLLARHQSPGPQLQ